MRHIIVDGYNVIRADPRLQALERVSLEHARDVLVQTLASSPRLVNDEVTVVFDGGRGRRDHVSIRRMGRIHILYSARGQTADEVIILHARSLMGCARTGPTTWGSQIDATLDGSRAGPPGARVVVVSNDGAVRESCREAGCEVSGSVNLLSQLPGAARGRREQAEDDDYEPTLSTVKRGNPRRGPRKSHKNRDVRF